MNRLPQTTSPWYGLEILDQKVHEFRLGQELQIRTVLRTAVRHSVTLLD